ncbi:MAG TPA: aminopeptidase P N-terminal domain-containing protein, partial [Gemmatimonadales bacterium]|nr:aminopeptidase P N-terminal domain-containing protein [Gemmatimonadales bacterium]
MTRLPALAAAALAAAVTTAPRAAQVTPAEHAARRTALLASIDSGVVVAFGAVEPVNFWPTFQQHASFLYLTGFEEPDAVLMLVKRDGRATETLFVPAADARTQRWVGKRTQPAETERTTGLAGRLLEEFRPAVDSLVAAGLPLYTISDVQTYDYARQDSLTKGKRFATDVSRGGTVPMTALDTVLAKQRASKSPAELALLRRAVDASVAAHLEAMRAVAPGCGEYEIQALVEGTFRRLGMDGPSYGSIVGSGPNSTVLHYMEDSRVMQAGELLVLDAGAAAEHYAADVTRTLPVSGKFTPEQRAVYQIVLDAQEAFVGKIRAGSTLAESHQAGNAVVAEGLARLGLIESPTATYEGPRCPKGGCPQFMLYLWHGSGGHGIGLNVHDPAAYYYGEGRFAVGDVFTVEPGIYVNPSILDELQDTPANRALAAKLRPVMAKYKDLGIRIEDDYALTEQGLEHMSAGAPREPAAVERLMAQRAPELPGGG